MENDKISYWFYFYFVLINKFFWSNSLCILAISYAKSSTSFLYLSMISAKPALWCNPKSSSN